MELAERYGVDALRYFLLREISFGQDGSYSTEAIVNRANSELANSFGNLAQRSLSMIFKNLDGVIPAAGEAPKTQALLAQVDAGLRRTDQRIRPVLLLDRPRSVDGRGVRLQRLCRTMAPWALKKTDPERMAAVLGTVVVGRAQAGGAVQPVIPASAEKLIALIESGKGGSRLPSRCRSSRGSTSEAEEAA